MAQNERAGLHRRTLLQGAGAVALTAMSASSGEAEASDASQVELTPQAVPEQAPAKAGLADLGDVKLAYWDTGGSGQPIVLLHPGTGSHAIWSYQQPVFARADYRVIGYSRRGYLGSEAGPKDKIGAASDDLGKLLDGLGVEKFHAVGVAAGGIVAIDFAISRSDRLHSIVLACTIGGVTDPEYQALSAGLRPKGFAEMPAAFREVGPSYRAANPEGLARWVELEHQAIHTPVSQPRVNRITFAALEQIKAPTLLLTGDADLWTPPSILPLFAKRIRGSEMAVIDGAGHSVYWEQPEAFNRRVLDFIGRHRG